MSWMRNALLKVLKYPVALLVRSKDVPGNLSELKIDRTKPLIYFLMSDSVSDQLALSKSAARLGLPKPTDTVSINGELYPNCYFLKGTQPLFGKKPSMTGVNKTLTEFFRMHRQDAQLDLQIVPVFITWGRAPDRTKPDFTDLIVSNATPTWLRKLFIILFLGRDSFISYSKAVSSREMADLKGSDSDIARKLIRLASTHFHRKRQSMIGPTLVDIQHRNNAILGSESVKQAISVQVEEKNQSSADAKKEALSYLEEISSDYREGLVRFGDKILTLIWNKIYNGIHVGHAHRIRELANQGHEIVYIPCHRSHMDYLLLTYVIYHQGLVTPHIAAGINLNFWPFGGIFRRSGAFFLRRSFAGKKLYTAVFREYLEFLFNKGYSVKFYPEGGRSRTGRVIPPKTGMLAMTVQAVLKGIHRPVSIVPVYIGYENVMEVKSYQKELKGSNKKKESPLQIFKAIRKLKNYGHGYVNFGEPITLHKYLDQHIPEWRNERTQPSDKKPQWLTPVVNDLATNIMTSVNTNAAANGMALTSLCLLSSKTHTLSEQELTSALSDFIQIQTLSPFSDDVTLPKEDAKQLLESTLSLQRLNVTQDNFGRLISPKDNRASLLTYYRNNIIHLFAIPSLIMANVFANKGVTVQSILTLVSNLYPLLQRELFMHMDEDSALTYATKLIATFESLGLVKTERDLILPPASSGDHYNSAWLLSRCMQETLQRYAVVLTILDKKKSINRAELERQSKEVAERLSQLYGISSPEFYDKNVFSSFTSALKDNAKVDSDESGNLCASEQSTELREEVFKLIWPEIAQHLENFDV